MDLQHILEYSLFGLPITHIAIAITIFLLGLALKNLIASIILKPLRTIAKRTKTTTDDKIIAVLEEPLKFSIVLVTTYIATLWLPFRSFDHVVDLAIKSFETFIIFWILYRMVDKFSNLFSFFSSKFGKELHQDIQHFITKALRIFLIALGIMAVLQEWGINVSAFVASLGLGGLAFALAAKDTVANLFGSLVIFTDRPFKVGDWVETPAVEGMIEEIGIRSTKIRTFAQALVSMPNATLANTPITNWSRMGKRRVKTRLGLTYNTSVEQMKAIIQEIKTMLKKHPDVHQETILVSFDEFDNSALSIFLYFFTKTTVWLEYLHVREDVNFKIMEIVARNGAQFAFPSQTLYVESLPK
ncbi:small-conductance mechanosensitive channel [Sulfurospirillum diekertiae]|uniref:Small-conductance mechanosensitive channel n=1 Tax=Sulfurospirillum diekertiae TaxID=1854492 RepID=A0A290HWU2_9BACT|nr:mechanosensitive ion channel family protein [Sulfurospirillum diekertiae]ATB70306.1 small-conductance mechanosensitive channel [Sulfurospirillum diekertiae]